jgi:predicted RND superfamily exporter protein
MVEFFNDNTEVSRSDRFIRERFGGSTQLILSVEADDTQTLLSPETLTALDGLSAYPLPASSTEAITFAMLNAAAGKKANMSANDLVREIERIDYTIHFIHVFKREYAAGGDFLSRTFAGTGKAILINAVSVGMGLGVLVFSQFRVLAQFGGLIALSMGVSVVVSLTVIPVLLTTVEPKFIYGTNSASR